MKQTSFSQVEFAGKKRTTHREVFLAEMEQVIPWSEVLGVIEPHYPRGKRGRPPVGLERMLREGTIADATILAAPPSVKNEAQARDPEMHQTKKGNQWYFVRYAHSASRNRRQSRRPASPTAPGGMKAHIGVDAESGLVHTVVGTAANVADVTQTEQVLHGEEKTVSLDAGYTGVEKREELKERDIDWQVAMKRGKLKAVPEDTVPRQLLRKLESVKASIRSKVEHPFHIVKNLFHIRKVRYKGLAKNTAQLHTLFGLANLMIAKRRLLALNGPVAP